MMRSIVILPDGTSANVYPWPGETNIRLGATLEGSTTLEVGISATETLRVSLADVRSMLLQREIDVVKATESAAYRERVARTLDARLAMTGFWKGRV